VLELQRLASAPDSRRGRSTSNIGPYRIVFQQLEALLRAGANRRFPGLVDHGLADGPAARCLQTLELYSQRSEGAACWALRTHASNILQWLVGRCTALSAFARHGDSERPLPDGSGRQGRVGCRRQRPARPGAGRGARPTKSAQLALSSVTRQGPGCWLGAALAARGPWCWAATNRSDYVTVSSCGRAHGSGRLQLLAPDPNLGLRPKTWVGLAGFARWARLHQGWSDSVREGTADVPGLARSYRRPTACCLIAATCWLLKQENDRTSTFKVSLFRLGLWIHRRSGFQAPIRFLHHFHQRFSPWPSSASAAVRPRC